MTSPSESAARKNTGQNGAAGIPVRLREEGVRAVSRLEFSALEKQEVVVEFEPEETTESLLRREIALLEAKLQSQSAELSVTVETARMESRAEARREWEEELQKRVADERSAVVKTCQEFHRERARYFASVEAEVVKLALAIAARVLHREAKVDPLLLAGVVRVALEQVADGSATVLRVPASQMEAWRGVFADGSEASLQLAADDRLSPDECVLETNVGRVELGIGAQLEEIERGFFDLIQQRPA